MHNARRRKFFHLLSAILLLSGQVPSAQSPSAKLAPEQSSALKPGHEAGHTGLPAGIAADWWTTAQEQIRQAEYQVTWQEKTPLRDLPAAYQAPNRAQNLRAYFTPDGVRLIPRQFEGDVPPWQWELSLAGYQRPLDPLMLPKAARTFFQVGEFVGWIIESPET